MIGFGRTIRDSEADAYLHDLRENLGAGKYRLLQVRRYGALIGLCTLRRNLNPNNRHIADLAKGMIAKQQRGGVVLPTAFHEICNQCEQDGVELLTLDVRAGTHAHRTWEHFGFRTYGTLEDYARVDGRSLAGHYMMQSVRALKARVSDALMAR